jgi:hypothetical protein
MDSTAAPASGAVISRDLLDDLQTPRLQMLWKVN